MEGGDTMNGTQDREAALLREELAQLLETLKHNREKVRERLP